MPTPNPTPTPTPSPTPSDLIGIGTARARSVGSVVAVAGIVTAEAGRLGTPDLLAIEDGTAAVVLHLADGASAPPRGSRVEVRGTLAAPNGQLEVKLAGDGLRVIASAALPTPLLTRASAIGEGTEARLLSIEGTVAATPWRSTSHDISFDVIDAQGGRVRVMADASSGLTTTAVRAGRSYRLVGVVGQRASRKDALDGYRVWLRDILDIVVLGTPVPTPSAAPTQVPAIPIARAITQLDATVVVEGTVTIPASLLDATGRRIVVQDASGAVEVLLPIGTVAPPLGQRLRVVGTMTRAYGAPRIRASAVQVIAATSTPEPAPLTGQPGTALEWRLARTAGIVASVSRLGSRWRAELSVGGQRVLVDGLPGAGIPSTALVAGRQATVIGIVRRPYPGASDQRFGLVPRGPKDLGLALTSRSVPAGGATAMGGSNGASSPGGGNASARDGAVLAGAAQSAPDVDLAALAEHVGEYVRVGGLVAEPAGDSFGLDDGTALAAVLLRGDAAAFAGLLEPGDAVNAVGLVVARQGHTDDWAVEVTSPDGLVRVGDLGEPRAIAGPGVGPVDPDPVADPAAANGEAGHPGRWLGLGGLLGDDPGGLVGLVPLLLLSAVSVAASALHRRRVRRRANARLAERLAKVVGPRASVA